MTDIKYTYLITDFLNGEVDITKFDNEIRGSSITTSLAFLATGGIECDCWFRDTLQPKDITTLSGLVSLHDGISDDIDDVQYVVIKSSEQNLNVDITDELRDRSGKLRIHQTSRKIGTIVCWTGEGDDPSNSSVVGNGESFSFNYFVGQNDPLIKYIDFNMVENETWLHEGYVTWQNCYLDTLDLLLVTRATSIVPAAGANYTLYGGYLIVPTPEGYGNYDVTSDITLHDGGLVYMPDNDQGEYPNAFFNAEWDPTTKRYINITSAPAGDGRYNLFAGEITLAHFLRKMHLLDSGFIALNSSDTDQLGHGMRLKMVADTNTTVSGIGDHNWSIACTMCLHRAKTV